MALGVKISFSWTNYCRLCLLDNNGIMVPIFENEGPNHEIVNKIETCLQLVTYDGDPLPRNICHKCLGKVNQAYEFRIMAMESYARLMSHLLPLKHVPDVQQYLQRAEQLQRSVGGFNEMSPTLWSASSPISSRSDFSHASKPKIYIKSEKDIIEGPSSSTMTSSSSVSLFSPPDSVAQDQVATSFLSMQSQGEEVDPTCLRNIHGDSLSRKRKLLGSDKANLRTINNITSEFKEPPKRKQLAGPASRKRLLQQKAQWQCLFCHVNFGNRGSLTSHMHNCLTCSTCQREFSSVREKAIHEAKEHMSVFMNCDLKHLRKRCTRCPARFASSVMLSTHAKHDHPSKSHTGKLPLISLQNNNINRSSQSSQVGCASEMLPDGEMSCDSVFESDDYVPLSDLKIFCKTESEKGPQVEFECPKCFRVCTNLHRLENHTCYQDKFKLNHCSLCNVAFLNFSDLQEHNNITHCKNLGLSKTKKNNTAKPASKKKIDDQSNGLIKKPVTPGLKKKVLSCHTCYAEFEEEEPFILHLYKHATEESDDDSKPKKKSRKIQSAQRKTSSVSSVEDSEVEQLSIKCERCFVVCRKEYYKVHLATHMSKAKTSYPCSECCQDFRNVEALNRHTCGGKQFKGKQTCCLDCGQNLVRDEDHICDNKCPECGKVFRSARGQRLHFVHKHSTTASLEGRNEHDEDHQLMEIYTDPDDLDEEQKSESVDHLETGEENSQALSEASNLSLHRKVNEESSHEAESADHYQPRPIDSQQSEKEEIPAAKESSIDEASNENNLDIPSSIDKSLPRERLPPDGAPVDDPVPCGAFGTLSAISSEKNPHIMGINRNVNAVS